MNTPAVESIKTMTSREIADHTGKNHKEVLRDIRQMIVLLDSAKLRYHCQSATYHTKQGKSQPMFLLDKDTTITLLSGYDVIARHKIITRWSQLETERLEEEANPELAVERGNARATKAWHKQGKKESWIDARIKGVSTRKAFTSKLATHGVHGQAGFRNCTNAIYTPLYGGTTEVVRMKKDLSPKDSIRDNMSEVELAATQLSELLALQTIEDQNLKGNGQCELACSHAAKSVATAILQNKRHVKP